MTWAVGMCYRNELRTLSATRLNHWSCDSVERHWPAPWNQQNGRIKQLIIIVVFGPLEHYVLRIHGDRPLCRPEESVRWLESRNQLSRTTGFSFFSPHVSVGVHVSVLGLNWNEGWLLNIHTTGRRLWMRFKLINPILLPVCSGFISGPVVIFRLGNDPLPSSAWNESLEGKRRGRVMYLFENDRVMHQRGGVIECLLDARRPDQINGFQLPPLFSCLPWLNNK